jgi:hypothetical protein
MINKVKKPCAFNITTYHLPQSIFSVYERPCDQDESLADYSNYLNKQYAKKIAVVDRTLQKDDQGQLLCRFDKKIYQFFQELILIDTVEMGNSWTLQDTFAKRTFNATFLAHITDQELGLFHPGESVILNGFFMNTTAVIKLTNIED